MICFSLDGRRYVRDEQGQWWSGPPWNMIDEKNVPSRILEMMP